MRAVLFSGTTEGRRLSAALAELGAAVEVCVATEYGREEQGELPGVMVHTGRLDTAAIEILLQGADLCIDATHPYATAVTANIRAAAEAAGVPYRRLLRRPSVLPEGSITAANATEAAKRLAETEGNILLATGAKELSAFAFLGGARLYPRVLPLRESLEACEAAGIPHRNIIAMQGPFSLALNLALMRQFDIRYLVTKDGGTAGGFGEKAEAARQAGATLVVIRRPVDSGEDYETILEDCRRLLR